MTDFVTQWATFVLLMNEGGWSADTHHGVWRHSLATYQPFTGELTINGKVFQVGTWREWLAADSSPVPF